MAAEIKIRVNEELHSISAAPDTPLLYVLSGELRLQGPRFGCGLAQCGSCSVLLDGAEIRSAMNGHLCRCGSYPRVIKAIERAAQIASGALHAANNEAKAEVAR